MKTVAIMPIKLNNERLPGKNTKQFSDGTPLLQVMLNTLRTLKKQGDLDEIYVFCSDSAIQKYLPADVQWLLRPEYLDSQAAKCNDILREFLHLIEADYYVLTAATSPFVSAEHIKTCVDAVRSGEYDSAFAAKKIQNFLWQNNKPVNFTLDSAPRTQDMLPYYCELSTPYVFTKAVFEQYGGRTGKKPYICECSEIECVDIDFPEDFELADIIYTHHFKKRERKV